MNSLTLLILPLLVRLFLSHLLIIKILKKMKLKLRQLVRTIQIKANLFQEHPIRQRRKRLETLRAIRLKIISLKTKKPHFCLHCGASGHTRPNCYKWLATQQSNSVLSSGGQGQIPPSLGPLGNLLKALMFLSNLNGFNSSPSPPKQRFNSKKGSSSKTKVWKEKGSK